MFDWLKKKESSAEKKNNPKTGWWSRWSSGLARTRHTWGSLFSHTRELNAAWWEDIRVGLLKADVGPVVTEALMTELKQRADKTAYAHAEALKEVLRQILVERLSVCQPTAFPLGSPQVSSLPEVLLVVGVNGSGKTTSIGKLAHYLKQQGQNVLLAAGDTFRAAAVEQLQIWAARSEVPCVAQPSGADSAAVIYDAYASARAKGMSVLIADTAGRLHTQHHLMDELAKVRRVLKKCEPSAPHHVWLVLDAGIGQNALQQVAEFHEAMTLTGLIITKLDGTAKGGIVFALAERFGLPIYFVGLGEGIEDLQPFDAQAYVNALLE